MRPDLAMVGGWGDPRRPARSAQRPRRLRVWKWKPQRRGALAGYVSIEFAIGLRMIDLPVFAKGTNGPWVALPTRPRLDRDRRQRLDVNGKPEFEAVAEWRNRETSDAFSRAVLAELIRAHPDALDGGQPELFAGPEDGAA